MESGRHSRHHHYREVSQVIASAGLPNVLPRNRRKLVRFTQKENLTCAGLKRYGNWLVVLMIFTPVGFVEVP